MKGRRTAFHCMLAVLLLSALALIASDQVAAGLGMAVAAHMCLLYASLNPSSQWLGPVVTGFDTRKKEVWLTIDDGPAADETLKILDLLEEHEAKATFFVVGCQAEANPDIMQRIVERGHQLGNHTMNHPQGSFWALSRRRIREEIRSCSDQITKITGVNSSLFRAPVGHKTWSLHPVLRKLDLTLIGWSARGFDGISTNSNLIAGRILKKIRPGAIVLLHDGRGSLEDTLSRILSDLDAMGYRCVLPSRETYVCGRRKTIR